MPIPFAAGRDDALATGQRGHVLLVAAVVAPPVGDGPLVEDFVGH